MKLIVSERFASINISTANTIVKIAEYSGLSIGKYNVRCRSQLLNWQELSIYAWLLVTPSITEPQTGFDFGVTFPSQTRHACIELNQIIDINDESTTIQIYSLMNPIIAFNLRVWIFKIK